MNRLDSTEENINKLRYSNRTIQHETKKVEKMNTTSVSERWDSKWQYKCN